MKPYTNGHRLLRSFLIHVDITALEFARLLQTEARSDLLLRPAKRTPTRAVLGWLERNALPTYAYRRLVDAVTEHYVPEAAWTTTEEAASGEGI
jgi:hypothetical protein